MKRTALLRRAPLRPPRPDRSEEFASHRLPAPTAARMATAADLMAVPRVAEAARLAKLLERESAAIRDSARGEDCQVRLPGCPARPDMTIWSHAPLKAAGKGLQIKALDLCGAYCCTHCDAIVDGQAPLPPGMSRDEVLMAWFMGHMRSLVRLAQKGLVRFR